jgi:hypothetical protein
MDELRWQPRRYAGLGPGVLRYNDANLLMILQFARVAAPDQYEALRGATRTLHQSSGKSRKAVDDAAHRLNGLLDRLLGRLSNHQFKTEDMVSMVDGLIDDGVRGEYLDYSVAEQVVLAIGSIMAALEQTGEVSEDQSDRVSDALDRLNNSLKNDDKFTLSDFIRSLKSFRTALAG